MSNTDTDSGSVDPNFQPFPSSSSSEWLSDAAKWWNRLWRPNLVTVPRAPSTTAATSAPPAETSPAPPTGFHRPNFRPYKNPDARTPELRGTSTWGHKRAEEGDPNLGTTEYAPFHPDETLRILAGAGERLGKLTPPQIGQSYNQMSGLVRLIGPIMDFLSGARQPGQEGAFGRGWDVANARRLGFQKQQYEMQLDQYERQMLDLGRKALFDHQTMMADINKVLFDEREGYIMHDQAEQEMENVLRKYNYNEMINLLHDRGTQAIDKEMEYQDKEWQKQYAAIMSVENSPSKRDKGKTTKEVNDYDKSLGPDDKEGGFGLGTGRLGAPKPPSSEAATEDSEFDQNLAKQDEISIKGVKAAHELVPFLDTPEEERVTKANPVYGPRVQKAAHDINNRLRQISSGDGTPEQKMKEMQAIDPKVTDTVQGLYNYRLDPKDPLNKTNVIRNLVLGVDKDWTEDGYDIVKKYMTGKEGEILHRVSGLVGWLRRGFAEIDKLPFAENASLPRAYLEKIWAESSEGAQEFAGVNGALRGIISDSASITQGRQAAASTINQIMRGAVENLTSKRAIRETIISEIFGANDNVQGVIRSFRREIRRNITPSAVDEKDLQDLDALARSNAAGEVPADASDELRAIGKHLSPETRKKLRVSKPLTRADQTQIEHARTVAGDPKASPEDRGLALWLIKKLESE